MQPFFLLEFSKGIAKFVNSFEYLIQPFCILLNLSSQKKWPSKCGKKPEAFGNLKFTLSLNKTFFFNILSVFLELIHLFIIPISNLWR